MERYINYKRFTREVSDDESIQKFYNEMIVGGWDIIYYNEIINEDEKINITIVAGKRQNTIL